MKIREKDVKVKKKNELELGAKVVEEISICKIPLYIYFKRKSYESEYKVYNVSENTYKKLLAGNDIQEDREDFLGNMPIEQDEIIWLVEKQNHQKGVWENWCQFNKNRIIDFMDYYFIWNLFGRNWSVQIQLLQEVD